MPPQHDSDIIPHQDEVEQVIDDQIDRSVIRFNPVSFVIAKSGFTTEINDPPYDITSYLIGPEAYLRFTVTKDAEAGFAANTWVGIANLAEALWPAWYSDLYGEVATSTVNRDGRYDLSSEDGELSFLPRESFASTMQYFQVFGLRYLLADPDAAREAIAAL